LKKSSRGESGKGKSRGASKKAQQERTHTEKKKTYGGRFGTRLKEEKDRKDFRTARVYKALT